MKILTNKVQREKAEALLLKKMIKNNPRLKKFLDANIDMNENDKELRDVVEPVIQGMLEDARTQGISIGFNAAMMSAYTKIEKCETVAEAVDILKQEANKVLEKFNLKPENVGMEV